MAAPPGTFPPGMVPPSAEGTFPPGMVPPGASPTQRPPPPAYGQHQFAQPYTQPPPAYPSSPAAAPPPQASPYPQQYGYAATPQPGTAYYPQPPPGYPPTTAYAAYPAVYYPGFAAVGRGMMMAGYPYSVLRPPIPGAISMPPPPKGVPAPILPTPPTVEKKTSVYVGKIPLGVKDETIKSLLEKCGTVVSWKRVEDVETKQPKGFGFCEYEKAEHVMRALRLLNGFFLGPTALLLKVDSKTQAYLDDFLVRKKAILKAARANATVTPGAPPPPPVEDQDAALEEEFQQTMLDEDARVQAAIKTVIDELIIDGTMALIEEKNSVPEPSPAPAATEEREEGEAERSPERRDDPRRDRDRERDRDRGRDRSRDRGMRDRDRRDRRSRSRSRERDRRDRDREPKDRDYRERSDRTEAKKEPLKDNTSALASDFLASLEAPSLQTATPPPAPPPTRAPPATRPPVTETAPVSMPSLRPPPPVEKPTPPPPQPWPPQPPASMSTGASPVPSAPPKKVPSHMVSAPVPLAVFSVDEDDGEREKAERKRMRPERIDYGEHALEADKKAVAATAKSIIDRIPTETDALFAFPINWEIYDEKKVGEDRMRPWVSKKVKEYLGEEEKSLVDYILRMLSEHRPPSDILTEVEAILDSDGPVFVVKLWRMLIFEVLRADSGLVLS